MLNLETLEGRDTPATYFRNLGHLFILANDQFGSEVTVNPGRGETVVTWHDNGLEGHSGTWHFWGGITSVTFQGGHGGLNEFVNNTPISDFFSGGWSLDNIYVGGFGNDVVGTGDGFNSITTRGLLNSRVSIQGDTGYGSIDSLGVHTTIIGDTNGYNIYNP